MKRWWPLVVIPFVNAALVVAQALVREGGVPEVTRYFEQGIILLVPLLVWALLRWRHGVWVLRALLVCLVLAFLVEGVKRSVPGNRRYAQLQACDWAADVIRADWKGPAADPVRLYSYHEYTRPNRPAVKSQDLRVVMLLDGREANPFVFGDIDIPDYIFCEPCNFDAAAYPDYKVLAEKTFRRRIYRVYRRNTLP